MLTSSQLFAAVEAAVRSRPDKPFTHVIVDEAQDLGVGELRMLGALASGPDALFFAGDIGQRIFQLPFSWLSLGVDVRGRSSSLRINYRTSRQIRETADQLLPKQVRDVDGIEEDRTTAQSVFEGSTMPPTKMSCARSSIPKGTYFTWHAPARGIICKSAVSDRYRSSSPIWKGEISGLQLVASPMTSLEFSRIASRKLVVTTT